MSEANKRARISYLQSLVVDYRVALESIAANTCCGKCQEAALVAKAAINPDEEIKQDSEFDVAVAGTGQRIMNAFRWKMQQGGMDLSYENMADLRSGIEGELIDFGTHCQKIDCSAADKVRDRTLKLP